MLNFTEQILFFSSVALLLLPAVWFGYLVAGNMIFWRKYEEDAPLFDSAPTGNWPEIAVLAILDDSHPEPWTAIKSALNQNYTNKEIIVVANGVKQDTLLTALEHLNGECFRILEFSQKVSLTEIYNLALKVTQAPSLFVAHPGVLLENDVITKLSMQLYQDSRVGVVYATQDLSANQDIWQISNNLATALGTIKKKASRIYGKLFVQNEKCALFRTNALIDIGGFDENAPNIIAQAGWKVQTLFWSARFESRAKYSLLNAANSDTLKKSCMEYEQQDTFMLKNSKDVLTNTKQRRLIYPYLNPVFRRFFYAGEVILLLLLAIFNPSLFATNVSMLVGLLILLALYVKSQSKLNISNTQLLSAFCLLVMSSGKAAIRSLGVFK